METQKFLSALARINELYRPFRKAFGIFLLLAFLMQIVGLAGPYLLGIIIDGMTSNMDIHSLYWLAAALGGLYFLEMPIGLLTAQNNNKRLDLEVDQHLSMSTLRKVLRLSLGQVINENSGFRQSVIGKGEEAIRAVVDTLLRELLPAVIKVAVTIVALLLVNRAIGMLATGFVVLYCVISIYLNARIVPELKKCRRLENEVEHECAEILRNLRLTILHAQEERVLSEYKERFRSFIEREKKMWLRHHMEMTCFREPWSRIGLLVVVLVTIYLIKSGISSPGQLVVSVSWSLILFSSMSHIGPMQRRLMRLYSLINRYFEMLEMPTAVSLAAYPVKPERIAGRIEFRNVSFVYPRAARNTTEESDDERFEKEGHTVCNISFTIEAGETCALVGHSGAGKTTLITLLVRGYDPNEGEILVDGINLRELDLAFYRQHIGCVEQFVRLWDGTVRDNILFGCANRTLDDSKLDTIARSACIDRFYHRLGAPKFEALVGENGILLSGGECQRVGIARAIAKNPAILIFDEATNSLDNINDALIQTAMKEALKGRTGIIIAHRLSTIRNADKIIVLERGSVVGVGKHVELIAVCSQYRELVEKEIRI